MGDAMRGALKVLTPKELTLQFYVTAQPQVGSGKTVLLWTACGGAHYQACPEK